MVLLWSLQSEPRGLGEMCAPVLGLAGGQPALWQRHVAGLASRAERRRAGGAIPAGAMRSSVKRCGKVAVVTLAAVAATGVRCTDPL
jgi:hypothetical protein